MTNDLSLDELESELSDFAQPDKKSGRPPREERIIAGFEDIQRFYEQHGRIPQHGEDKDIFERIYAVRLDRLRTLEECRALLEPRDRQGLLTGTASISAPVDMLGDDELMAELDSVDGTGDITELRHVRTTADKRAAEEIANRTTCPDFDLFKRLFQDVQRDLDNGTRVTRQIRKDAGFLKADVKVGDFFILYGQTLYIADVGTPMKASDGSMDARLRVIYSNGTESNLLLDSLRRAFYKDEASRIISEPSAGPLFSNVPEEDDISSGTIYVLRSKSDHPFIEENRDVIHKIGVTGGHIRRHLANARLDSTFLMADVEVVATYELANINRTKLENILHRFFESAKLDIEINDRLGNPILPKEWFLVPLFVIDEAIQKIANGTITSYSYDKTLQKLVFMP